MWDGAVPEDRQTPPYRARLPVGRRARLPQPYTRKHLCTTMEAMEGPRSGAGFAVHVVLRIVLLYRTDGLEKTVRSDQCHELAA